MTLPNRKAIREAIGAGIASATSALAPAPTVYDYMKTGFDGESPIVRIWSESSLRPDTRSHGINTSFGITVQTWVLVDENGTDAQQAESEDILDAIEYAIADWIEQNIQTDDWNQIRFDRPSLIQTTLVGPYTYIVEQNFLEVLTDD